MLLAQILAASTLHASALCLDSPYSALSASTLLYIGRYRRRWVVQDVEQILSKRAAKEIMLPDSVDTEGEFTR